MRRIGLVIGGGSGIGAASAVALATRGLEIAIADLDLPAAAGIAASLSGEGHRGYHVDMTNEQQVAALFEAVEREMGHVAVLIVAAAATGLERGAIPSIRDLTVDNWDRTMMVNTRGPFLCVREMLRHREKTAVQHGRIILISSKAAQAAALNSPPSYIASKGAVLSFIRPAATEAAAFGITVNAIAPGWIDTPMLRSVVPPEEDEKRFGTAMIGRLGKASEVAHAIDFLASEGASYVNGACLDVNGGVFMR